MLKIIKFLTQNQRFSHSTTSREPTVLILVLIKQSNKFSKPKNRRYNLKILMIKNDIFNILDLEYMIIRRFS